MDYNKKSLMTNDELALNSQVDFDITESVILDATGKTARRAAATALSLAPAFAAAMPIAAAASV